MDIIELQFPKNGFIGIFHHLSEIRFSGTLALAMPGDQAFVSFKNGDIWGASWGSRHNTHALSAILALSSGECQLFPMDPTIRDEICLSAPALITHLRSIEDVIRQSGLLKDIETFKKQHVKITRDVFSRFKEAKHSVRTRSELKDLPSDISDEFPTGFITELISPDIVDRIRQKASLSEFEWQEPPIGSMLGKCYLAAEIGRGATAIVYRAMHLTLKSDVAVKVFKPNVPGAGSVVHEAQILAKLNHPNLIRVMDCNDEQPYPYVVMEYVDGMTLENAILQSGKIQDYSATDILIQALHCLMYAHGEGVIHCDIKPDNFIIGKDQRLRIADLGLAKAMTIDFKGRQCGVIGTPAYISPEVVNNGIEKATSASDIYSLGCTAFHMLTGHPPFMADDGPSTMVLHVTSSIPSILSKTTCDKKLDKLIQEMMSKEPRDRPTAAQAHEILESIKKKITPVKRDPTALFRTISAWSGKKHQPSR